MTNEQLEELRKKGIGLKFKLNNVNAAFDKYGWREVFDKFGPDYIFVCNRVDRDINSFGGFRFGEDIGYIAGFNSVKKGNSIFVPILESQIEFDF